MRSGLFDMGLYKIQGVTVVVRGERTFALRAENSKAVLLEKFVSFNIHAFAVVQTDAVLAGASLNANTVNLQIFIFHRLLTFYLLGAFFQSADIRAVIGEFVRREAGRAPTWIKQLFNLRLRKSHIQQPLTVVLANQLVGGFHKFLALFKLSDFVANFSNRIRVIRKYGITTLSGGGACSVMFRFLRQFVALTHFIMNTFAITTITLFRVMTNQNRLPHRDNRSHLVREFVGRCAFLLGSFGRGKKSFISRLSFFFVLFFGQHFSFSFSKVQAPTRLRFLSRETGLPNKSLHVKKKIPFALDSLNYKHFPVTVKIS